MLRRLWREPLVHFLLIGLLLFALYAVMGGKGGDRDIRIDDKAVAALAGRFQATWQRPPTPTELDELVESYVREEIFYREGLALGLDRDDPTIRRRVGQNYQIVAEESESASAPSDSDLAAWLKQNPARYGAPSLVTFTQVTLPDAAAEDSIRKALAGGADPATLGAGRMLLPQYDSYPADLIDRDFGDEFAKAVLAVPRGRWEGPVRSGYGLHLVRVEKVVAGQPPRLEDVRAAVARDYEQDRRRRAAEEAYRKLRRSYSVDYSGSWKPTEAR